jgi:phage terminase large subunit
LKQVVHTNKVYRILQKETSKIIAHQGGTRSGKTYNILLYIIFDFCHKQTNKMVTIVRKSFPAVRGTVMRDFFDIIKQYDLYSEDYHNKTANEYIINTNVIEFISLDQPQKIRGRKRDLLFINEANELDYEDWQQLVFRTSDKIVLDYNPSDEFHWIYDKVLTRDDCSFYKTTYKDNPFLPQQIVKEIERLQDTDDNYWRVYGLGERGQSRSLVFSFRTISKIPHTAKLVSYGLDFGFSNDPTALVATYIEGTNIYVEEKIYRTGLTNQDIAKLLEGIGLDRRDEIFADSAEPKSIEEIHRMGWNIKPTVKGAINQGIDMLRRYKLYVTSNSSNVIKEMRNYKYIEDKNGDLTNKPVDKWNHSCDALRYSVINKLSRPNYGKYAIR